MVLCNWILYFDYAVFFFCFFFFFQAEDGIRDLTVTGVQTCALPICRRFPTLALCSIHGFSFSFKRRKTATSHGRRRATKRASSSCIAIFTCLSISARSEERRVGKECRSGMSTSQYKKKNNISYIDN